MNDRPQTWTDLSGFSFPRFSPRLPAAAAAALTALMCVAGGGRAFAEPIPERLSDELLAEGWIRLFDGQSLFGWRPASAADWQVEEGAIVVAQGEPGLLRTTNQWGDFALRLEFRLAAGANSGVFLRTSPQPRNPAVDCYEVNLVAGENPFPTGSLVGRRRAETTIEPDRWHALEIMAERGRFTVRLDGQEVLAYDDPQPLGRGYIGLQYNQGGAAFRNVLLRPLGLGSLFNGKDLSGWRTHPDMESAFTVTPEGFLHVRGGRGQLETESAWGDFVLQLECISHGEHLNSGIFFRCIPGDVMMGYESQIHHGYHEGDRRRPIDCGTGGIFRRVDARFVMADDFEWFSKTIVAEGPRIAVWVNGVQVTEWTDARDPDENPRRGLRTEPGTIIIQGHDETTDLSFRNFRAGEIPPRW